MTIPFIPWRKLTFFVALSGVDLLLTWLLLQGSDGSIYECNPVANWWLVHTGWLGLAGFKFSAVALVAGICAVLCLYRPRAGARVLSFACSVLVMVVLYSSALAGYVHVQSERPTGEDLPALAAQERRLDERLRDTKQFHELRRQLARSWREQRITFDKAVAQLQETALARDPAWRNVLRMKHPDMSDEQCLAANFAGFVQCAEPRTLVSGFPRSKPLTNVRGSVHVGGSANLIHRRD